MNASRETGTESSIGRRAKARDSENNAEGLLLFTKIAPYLERFRKEFSPNAFKNAEWAATETAAGKQRFALFQKRIEQMLKAQG